MAVTVVAAAADGRLGGRAAATTAGAAGGKPMGADSQAIVKTAMTAET